MVTTKKRYVAKRTTTVSWPRKEFWSLWDASCFFATDEACNITNKKSMSRLELPIDNCVEFNSFRKTRLMKPTCLLVANRGEIAIRILRAASELGIRTVAIFSEDDASSLHTRKADEARPLCGAGVAAYLDGEHILAVAKEAGCDAIHPGYGFLSENAGFARRCVEEGITFVGPRAEILGLFGDK